MSRWYLQCFIAWYCWICRE